MNRVLSAVSSLVVVVLSSCGGGAGRCTADSQCPVGSSCDETVGVCVMPGSGSSNGGGSGATGGGSGGNPSMISASYGKGCASSSDCASAPGTTCHSEIKECLSSCANGAKCPTGAECVGNGYDVCVRTCDSHGDCAADNFCNVSSSIASKACQLKKDKWSLGRECGNDSECEDNAFCVKKNGQAQGVCTKVCAGSDECGIGQECVITGSSGASACFNTCYAVGQQATCTNGFTCRALSGVSYGWCG